MPLLIVLCLALLRAFVPTPAGHAPAAPVVEVARAHVDVTPGATRASREAARAALPERGEMAARAERPDGCAPSAPTPVAPPRLPSGATFAAAVRARTLEASHAVAARGAVLPYFPTAPPLQS